MQHSSEKSAKKISKFIVRAGSLGAGLLRLLPPESAHHLALGLLRTNLLEKIPALHLQPQFSRGPCMLPGVGRVMHPIGLGAGFDKSATCFRQLAGLGFSFLEVGTITPLPQAGNPKPRIFRLPAQRALINRMGFNNDGLAAVKARLQRKAPEAAAPLVGVNIGINKSTPLGSALEDYLRSLRELRDLAPYFVVNISSPNTPALRSLANPQFIAELAEKIAREISAGLLSHVWIKLDPDLDKPSLQRLIAVIAEKGFAGLVLTNTHKVSSPWQGGLSGHPLAIASSSCLEWAWEVHRGALPMIGCGGILSGEDILQKIMRGAACVQIYTAMIYRGPWVVWELLQELEEAMKLRGFADLDEALGSFYR